MPLRASLCTESTERKAELKGLSLNCLLHDVDAEVILPEAVERFGFGSCNGIGDQGGFARPAVALFDRLGHGAL